jgi:hypothetical protein
MHDHRTSTLAGPSAPVRCPATLVPGLVASTAGLIASTDVGRTVATDLRHAGSDTTQRLCRQFRSAGDADAYLVEGEVLLPGRVIRMHCDAVYTGVRIAMRDGPPKRVRPVAEIPAQGVS